jgi:hypothetical protein
MECLASALSDPPRAARRLACQTESIVRDVIALPGTACADAVGVFRTGDRPQVLQAGRVAEWQLGVARAFATVAIEACRSHLLASTGACGFHQAGRHGLSDLPCGCRSSADPTISHSR